MLVQLSCTASPQIRKYEAYYNSHALRNMHTITITKLVNSTAGFSTTPAELQFIVPTHFGPRSSKMHYR